MKNVAINARVGDPEMLEGGMGYMHSGKQTNPSYSVLNYDVGEIEEVKVKTIKKYFSDDNEFVEWILECGGRGKIHARVHPEVQSTTSAKNRG